MGTEAKVGYNCEDKSERGQLATGDALLTLSPCSEGDMAGPKSSTGRSPAFQFYPDTFLSDANVIVMSMAERGVYITLICICWQQGSIPADTSMLARLCLTPLPAFKKLWPNVERCFRPKADVLVHPRLELERRKQEEFRREKSDAGKSGAKKRWHKHGPAIAKPSQSNGTATDVPMASDSSLPLISDLQSLSLDSGQKSAPPASIADARSKRPIFKGNRLVVFEWQLDDLRRLLGSHTDGFDLHAWFDSLDQEVMSAGLVVPQRDGGKWLQEQALNEAARRGLPVATTAGAGVQGKTAGNMAAAARFVARGAQGA